MAGDKPMKWRRAITRGQQISRAPLPLHAAPGSSQQMTCWAAMLAAGARQAVEIIKRQTIIGRCCTAYLASHGINGICLLQRFRSSYRHRGRGRRCRLMGRTWADRKEAISENN